VRGPGPTVNACAFILTTQVGDLDQLAVVAAQLAREHTGCSEARLLLDDHPDAAATISAAAGDGRRVDLPLAHGRALLSLSFVSDAATLIDAHSGDCGWIDLLDLRLRELLTARDLRREAAAAHRSEHLQEALYAIADLAYSNLDVGEMLASVHQIVGRLTYAKNFYIALYDDARDAVHFPYNADEGEAAMSQAGVEVVGADYPHSLTFAVLHTGRSLLGPSRDLRAALGLGDDVRLGQECVDWLGVPMLEGERVRGAVVVQSYDERVRYTEEDRSLLAFVAQHILTAVSRKQAQEQLEAEVLRRTAELAQANDALRQEAAERERAQRLQAALFRIAELASERGSIDEFYAGVHSVVSGLLNARNFFIALLSEDGTELHFPYLADERDEALHTRRLTNGITEWVLRQRRPLLATASEIRALIEAGEMVMFGSLPECWLGVPLMLDGRAFGVMVVQSYDSDQDYGPAEQEILQFASFHIATAFERRQTQERLRKANIELEKRVESRTRELKLANADLRNQIVVREQIESQLQHEALHDALTGLPNRTALLSKMESALARYQVDPSRMFAVLFLDLDRFKVVNDSVGHLLGDELLIEAGRRIAACARGPDSVARLGGDEFTLLIEDIHGIDDAKHVAKRVIAALVDPIRVGDKEIYSSASVGIALAHPRYRRPEELLRDADVAMYRAKAHGRQRFEVFDEQLHQEALDILDLESDLRRALLRHQFEPYLQPIVRLADAPCLATRRCCVGVIPRVACCFRDSFSPLPKTRAVSSRSTGSSTSRCCVPSRILARPIPMSASMCRRGISVRRILRRPCWR
jgi:diguanylate cyclase (GGDEF)-like protein